MRTIKVKGEKTKIDCEETECSTCDFLYQFDTETLIPDVVIGCIKFCKVLEPMFDSERCQACLDAEMK